MLLKPIADIFQLDQGLQQTLCARGFVLAETADFFGKQRQCLAIVLDSLAPEQVQRLDAVGTLIDLRDAYIAYPLFLTSFTDVSMATEDLLAKHSAF